MCLLGSGYSVCIFYVDKHDMRNNRVASLQLVMIIMLTPHNIDVTYLRKAFLFRCIFLSLRLVVYICTYVSLFILICLVS